MTDDPVRQRLSRLHAAAEAIAPAIPKPRPMGFHEACATSTAMPRVFAVRRLNEYRMLQGFRKDKRVAGYELKWLLDNQPLLSGRFTEDLGDRRVAYSVQAKIPPVPAFYYGSPPPWQAVT